MTTPTYWLEPTDRVATGLRRYSRRPDAGQCTGDYHQALAWTGEQPARFEDGTYFRRHLAEAGAVGHDDPRWPVQCVEWCDYVFTPDDEWQEWQELLYRRTDTGATVVLHPLFVPPGAEPARPGASLDAWWYPDDWRGADGVALVVYCPAPGREGWPNEWGVDRPASSGNGKWARTGDPRACDVTASPSIAIGVPGQPGYYHGWLNAGQLSEHIG